MAHIQPGADPGQPGRQSGATLRQTLRLMGRFAGYGRVTHVFGLGDCSPYANVAGVRIGGAWQLYAQRLAGTNGPIQGVTQIV